MRGRKPKERDGYVLRMEDGTLVEVGREVYLEWYQSRRRERYQKEKNRKHGVYSLDEMEEKGDCRGMPEMVKMESAGERVNLEFDMPSRGIIGLRTNVLTASAGEAIMAHRFKEYQPYKGEIERRTNGSMIAMESGTAFAYAIDKLQDRGKFFIFPQEEVYAGQVVGEHSHDNDLVINVTKSKKLTNMRASGSDDKARLIPPVQFSLEEALEYIKEDEYVEVTPKSMRMRKVILDELERKRANKN